MPDIMKTIILGADVGLDKSDNFGIYLRADDKLLTDIPNLDSIVKKHVYRILEELKLVSEE